MISLWEYWAILTWEVDIWWFDIWWFEAFCLPFSGTEGPPKGLRGSPMVLKGETSVPWKVKIKYSTMEWFHYGNTVHYSLERWTKEYMMIWGFYLLFSGNEGPPNGPIGSPIVLNGHTIVPWEVEIKFSTMGWFHYGNTELFLTWEVDKGIFDDLSHFFAIFRHWRAP